MKLSILYETLWIILLRSQYCNVQESFQQSMLSVISGYVSLGDPFCGKGEKRCSSRQHLSRCPRVSGNSCRGPEVAAVCPFLMGCMRIQIRLCWRRKPPAVTAALARHRLCSLRAFSRCWAYGPVLGAPGWFGLVGLGLRRQLEETVWRETYCSRR